MATGVWMGKDVLLQFKLSLRAQRQELRRAIEAVEQELRSVADSTADRIDLSTGNALRESMASLNSQNCRRLRTIEGALDRIQKGRFGICVGCDGDIGLKRLQAIPSATRCIACQERLEQGTPERISYSSERLTPSKEMRHDSN